jgi:hypothetical protein
MGADGLFHGVCVGGPLSGKAVAVRSSEGFLAADKAAGKAWRYRYFEDNTFRVDTGHDDSLVYPQGVSTGERVIDWDRMPLSTDPLEVISLGTEPEAYAGDPVDDGWDASA